MTDKQDSYSKRPDASSSSSSAPKPGSFARIDGQTVIVVGHEEGGDLIVADLAVRTVAADLIDKDEDDK